MMTRPSTGTLGLKHTRIPGLFLSVGLLLFMIRFWKRMPAARALSQEPSVKSSAVLFRRFSNWIQAFKPISQLGSAENLQNGGTSQENPTTTASDVARLHETSKEIQQVLKFWFGQYPPNEAQKKLWMISSQSTDVRAKVDAEISGKFSDILDRLSKDSSLDRHEWCSSLYGYQGKLATIVVLDQFSRHILRHHSRENEQSVCRFPSQDDLDRLALETAKCLMKQHEEEFAMGMLPVPMRIFALMPFRHANTLEMVQFVQTEVDASDDLMLQSNNMLKRFRSATVRRMAVLQDEARRSGGLRSSESPSDMNQEEVEDSILEMPPFDADLSTATKHVVYQTIRIFLEQQGIQPPSRTASPSNGGINQEQPIIVSLSGGVDSMVIASVLAHFAKHYQLLVVAVHIDYGNRPESSAEASYVQKFCNKHGIVYRCRRIEEVTRGVTARDAYERIAREVRYSFYRQVIQEFDSSDTPAGVVLGHHRGDLRENVLSNSHKGCGPLDLSGMTAVSQNDGVRLFRPLLPLEKSTIFDYAHTYGVPYFKDTTPHWSTRGKLRNRLLPLLEEIYGEGSMNNLSNLAIASDQCRELVFSLALLPFLKSVDRTPMGLSFETGPWKHEDQFFWKFVLRETLHSGGLGMFTDKMVTSFLHRVRADTLREGWLQCRKDYAVYLEKTGRVHVLFPSSFPFRKSDAFDCVGKTVRFGADNAVYVGPWKVTAHLLPHADSMVSTREQLEKRAISGVDDLMKGTLDYYVQVPSWIETLTFTRFTKATRPRAWKSIDPKIQETLPLLGISEAFEPAVASEKVIHVARVRLELESEVSTI